MGSLFARSIAAATLAAVALTLVACGPVAPAPVDPVTSQPSTATEVPAPQDSEPAEPVDVGLSPESLAYAAGLGGSSHQGQTLYVVIGASVDSEPEARVLLEDAIPLFGDMQSYFIVQRSDNFEGMTPGWWVVFESYRDEPSPGNLEFGRRAFPDAYVKRVTVRTADPIPVYEDMVDQ